MSAAEQHRVATLEAHHDVVCRGSVDEPLVDELLRGRLPAAALADGDLHGARRESERIRMHQSIVKDDVGALEQLRRAQGQQIRCAGARADEIDCAGHWIIPAATVLFVVSSSSMKLPVARFSA